ncbi:MAG TPA: hypothetical protein VEF76_11770 [Patescibacteria group bacterium]|nr:hypothetical protein [Patescibacteria group bacterium]
MKAEFNTKSEKVVNTDEYRRIRMDLEWKQLRWKEKAFQAFVEEPYRAWLFVKSGFAGAWEQMTKGKVDEPGNYYYDSVTQSQHGTTYMDRSKFEGDLAYFQKNGLSANFQEKSARIAREAFEKSRDFSVLVRTGQLKSLDFGRARSGAQTALL